MRFQRVRPSCILYNIYFWNKGRSTGTVTGRLASLNLPGTVPVPGTVLQGIIVLVPVQEAASTDPPVKSRLWRAATDARQRSSIFALLLLLPFQ
jgi:hypothetical protein